MYQICKKNQIDCLQCALTQQISCLPLKIDYFTPPTSPASKGVGQLLFEVCNGVPTQFHTCTAKVSRSMLMMSFLCQHLPLLYPPLLPHQVLPLVLLLMGDPHLPGQEIFTSLTIMVELMAKHTRRDHASLLWDCLLVCWGRVCVHVKVCVCVHVCECVLIYCVL